MACTSMASETLSRSSILLARFHHAEGAIDGSATQRLDKLHAVASSEPNRLRLTLNERNFD